MDGRKQTGILASAAVDDYATGKIKRHEYTIKKKEEDRTRLSDTQGANLGPVFLTFKGGEDIAKRMTDITETQQPYVDVVADDGVRHSLWKCSVDDSNFFEKSFEAVPSLYIADGHHRAASAYNVGKMRRERAIEAG